MAKFFIKTGRFLTTLRFQLTAGVLVMFIIAIQGFYAVETFNHIEANLKTARADAALTTKLLGSSYSVFTRHNNVQLLSESVKSIVGRSDVQSVKIFNSDFQFVLHHQSFKNLQRVQKTRDAVAHDRDAERHTLNELKKLAKNGALPIEAQRTELIENDRFVIGAAVEIADKKTFYAIMSFDEKSMMTRWIEDAELLRNEFVLFLIAIGAIVLLFMRWATSGLVNLQHASRQVAMGDFSTRVKTAHHREVFELGVNFNKMVASMEEQFNEINELALIDRVTGLPNRLFFQKQLNSSIAAAKRHKRFVALLFVDLDGFKLVNDTLGHDAGDELLMLVAKRISDCVRTEDVVARDKGNELDLRGPTTSRIGGDEFTLILPEIKSAKYAGIVAQRILDSLREEFELSHGLANVGASIGISCYPFDAEDEVEILKNADVAMYAAKKSGKNTYVYFSDDLNASKDQTDRLTADIGMALPNKQLYLEFQPIINLVKNDIYGEVAIECHLSWKHPELGVLPASDFCEASMQAGYCSQILDFEVQGAIELLKQLPKSSHFAPYISIGLFAATLHHPRCADSFVAAIQDNDISGDRLRVRLSTEAVMSESPTVINNINRLIELGVTFVLDDFTRSAAALDRIGELPVKRIKVNCDTKADGSKTNEFAIRSALAIAREMGFVATAKGIEKKAHLSEALDFGFVMGTGRQLVAPMGALQFFDWYSKKVEAKSDDSNHTIKLVK